MLWMVALELYCEAVDSQVAYLVPYVVLLVLGVIPTLYVANISSLGGLIDTVFGVGVKSLKNCPATPGLISGFLRLNCGTAVLLLCPVELFYTRQSSRRETDAEDHGRVSVQCQHLCAPPPIVSMGTGSGSPINVCLGILVETLFFYEDATWSM